MTKASRKDARHRLVQYRVNDEEYAKLIAGAEVRGWTLSYYARAKSSSDDEPFRAALEPPAMGEASAGDILIAEQIRRVGINLNQVVHVQNMLMIPAPPELHPLLIKIDRYLDFVLGRIDR